MSSLAASHPLAGAATLLVFAAVLLLVLRNVTIAFLVTLVVIGSASSVYERADEYLRTIRWGALAALVVGGLLIERRDPIRRASATLLLVPIAILAPLSTLWSVYPSLTAQRSISFGAMLAAAVLLAPRLELALFAAGSGIVAMALACAAFVLWAVTPGTAILGGQLEGPLQNPNTLGIALGLLVPISLAGESAGRRLMSRRLFLLVPAAACIAAAGNRTGLLIAVIGLAILAVRVRGLRSRATFGVALIIASTLAFTLTSLQPQGGGVSEFVGVHNNPGLHRSRLTTLLGARNEAWSASAKIIEHRPVNGFGFGTGEDHLYSRFGYRFTWFQGGGPSNGYVQAAMDLGLAGLVVLLVPIAYAAWIARTLRGRDVWLFALLAMSLVAAVFESTLTSAGAPWAYLVWFPVAALLSRGIAGRTSGPSPRHRQASNPA